MNMPHLGPIGRAIQSALPPFATSTRRARPNASRGQAPPFLLESLEDRILLDATLGIDPLVFDPTPASPTSGDEVTIGTITYQLTGTDSIKVTYRIDADKQAVYDLSAVETKINGGDFGSDSVIGLPDNTETVSHTLSLAAYLPLSTSTLDIDACATIDKRDVGAVGAALPTVGTVKVVYGADITGLPSYFDTIVTPGWIAKSTDVDNNTVTFDADPGWATGEAVRVVQGYTSVPTNTGLVAPPTTTDTTTSATYYVRNLGAFTYSFHSSYNDALADTGKRDIIAALPTTGELIITGENDALAFLGQTPRNESLVPASTKTTLTTTTGPLVTATDTTNDTVDLVSAVTWVSGDRVQVSATGGGLVAGTTYFVRMVDSDTVSFHTTWAGATAVLPTVNRANITSAIALTTTVNSVDGDDEAVTLTTDPGWATGTGVRVNATGGGLSVSTTYFVRSLGAGVYSFFDTAANATNTDLDANPLNGRKDFTAPITASAFTNLTQLSFDNDHNWTTGTVVRVNASGGGLTAGTNYYVNAIDGDSISLHTTLTNAQGNTSPVTFTAPIVALITPMFDGWCVDNDRFIAGGEYVANIYSSYDLGSFTNTADDPKDSHLTEGGIAPINTSMVPSGTDTTADQVTFTTQHGWATQQAVQVTATDVGGLSAGTTYYVRSINANTLSFHTTAAGASTNTDRIDLTTAISASTIVFRAQSIDFKVNTEWPNGSPVRVSVNDGGLLAGTTYFARAQNIVGGAADANSISLYDTREHAVAGGTTGLITFTDPIETITFITGPTVTATDTTNETVDLSDDVSWSDGDAVQVSATGGGLTAGVTYYVRKIDANTVSFFSSAANAQGLDNVGRVNLNAALLSTTTVNPVDPSDTTQTVFYVPETLVEYPENMDVLNWVLNQKYPSQLADGRAPTATDPTNNTVTVPVYGWTTGLKVQVSATGGGLAAGTDYYIRALNTTTIAFYATTADASNNVNRIVLTGDIQPGLVRPYYTEGDVQRTVWELIDNTPGNPGDYSPLRVAEILAEADAAVGLNKTSVDFVPGCDGTVAIILQPFQVKGPSNEQITVAQITVAQIPNYCAEGKNCQELIVNLGTIGDTVWVDSNGNGLQDESGTGVLGVTVKLLDGSGNTIGTTTTNGTGGYEFTGLLPGTYTVQFVSPVGYVFTAQNAGAGDSVDSDADPTDGKTGTYTLAYTLETATVGSDRTADAGVYGPVSFATDSVWVDTNGNGQQDAGEPGLDGVSVTLKGAGPDGILGTGDDTTATTTTSNGGAYAFTGLAPGAYTVTFGAVAGYTRTVADTGADATDSDAKVDTGTTRVYTLSSGETNDSVDAGYYQPASLGNFVWVDTNGNGQQEADEPGINAVTVTLTGAGPDGIFGTGDDTTATQYTANNGVNDGAYLFTNLAPGRYSVQFSNLPAGYVFTPADTGADATDSDATPADGKTGIYTLVSGQAPELTVDAGVFKTISITGVKVHDVDYDGAAGGINDRGDMRLAGLRVYLDDGDSALEWTDAGALNGVWDEGEGERWTRTAADGSYAFTNLGPGTYDVREDLSSLPGSGWSSTTGTADHYTISAVSGQDATVNFYNNKFQEGPPGPEYSSYTLGGYQGKGQPGQYLLANFAAAFPTGLVVPRATAGATNDIVLGSGAKTQEFLSASTSKKFTGGGATNYVPSTLEKQFVALSLNIRFDEWDPNFDGSSSDANGLFGNLTLYGLTGNLGAANGLTISQLWAQVYRYLDAGTGYTLGLSSGDLTSLLNNLNLSFDNGKPTSWAELHLY